MTLYTSCRRCPMCANAIARGPIARVVFAVDTGDLDAFVPPGYRNPDAGDLDYDTGLSSSRKPAHSSATTNYAERTHGQPRRIRTPTSTQNVEVAVAGGTTMHAYLARPSSYPARNGVTVIHELFGVNPDIRAVTDALARAGYMALAPELYHRNTAAGAWLPRDDTGRAAGFALVHHMTPDQAVADVRAAPPRREPAQNTGRSR